MRATGFAGRVASTHSEKNDMARGVGGQSPSNVQSYLAGVSYPATKQDLVKAARQNDAPRDILQILEGLDEGKFGGPQDVMKAYSRERHEVS
jgi:Protein of unknown function (DUF2795)